MKTDSNLAIANIVLTQHPRSSDHQAQQYGGMDPQKRRMKMKILVTTPTGKIGRRVLHELLAPEFGVRVITRDPARLPDEVLEQADVVCGSIDDPTASKRRQRSHPG